MQVRCGSEWLSMATSSIRRRARNRGYFHRAIFASIGVISKFSEAVEAARGARPARRGELDTSSLHDGPEVQLSVRVRAGLRAAVASTANAQGTTVTAFVEQVLQRAVIEANDSFAGLSADLAANMRAELHAVLKDGAYREAASEVDREEA